MYVFTRTDATEWNGCAAWHFPGTAALRSPRGCALLPSHRLLSVHSSAGGCAAVSPVAPIRACPVSNGAFVVQEFQAFCVTSFSFCWWFGFDQFPFRPQPQWPQAPETGPSG